MLFREALSSVLAQTLTNIEILIVEAPSHRMGKGVVDSFSDSRLRYILQPIPTCLADQLNRGLNEARAEIVARLDADDICEPTRLAEQLEYMQEHPDVGVLGSHITIIDTVGNRCGYRAYPESHEAIMAAMASFNPVAHPAVMFHRNIALEAGGYQGGKYIEDYDLWCRLAQRGVRFANLPKPLLRYRVHPGGMKSARLRNMIRATLQVKDKYWKGRMSFRARLRYWGERLLLCLPPRLVLKLFLRMHQ